MKSVLISIQPTWCEKIVKGEKTIEVRKTRPKIETPFKCYIYCTKTKNKWSLCSYEGAYQNNDDEIVYAQQHIIGEFVCDWITEITPYCDIEDFVNQYIHGYPTILGENDCLSFQEMKAYLGNKNGYDWHISDLKIYDKPKELSEFERPCSYKGTCYYCARAKFESDGTLLCNTEINRAPQSWCYVEELKEKQK